MSNWYEDSPPCNGDSYYKCVTCGNSKYAADPPDACPKCGAKANRHKREEEDQELAERREVNLEHISGIVSGAHRIIGGLPSEEFDEDMKKLHEAAQDLYVKATRVWQELYGDPDEYEDEEEAG